MKKNAIKKNKAIKHGIKLVDCNANSKSLY